MPAYTITYGGDDRHLLCKVLEDLADIRDRSPWVVRVETEDGFTEGRLTAFSGTWDMIQLDAIDEEGEPTGKRRLVAVESIMGLEVF